MAPIRFFSRSQQPTYNLPLRPNHKASSSSSQGKTSSSLSRKSSDSAIHPGLFDQDGSTVLQRKPSNAQQTVLSNPSLDPTTNTEICTQSGCIVCGKVFARLITDCVSNPLSILPKRMAKAGGLALKGVQLFLRFIEFCCAAIILGIFAYFLAALSNNNLHIDTYLRAVTGISGAGVLYTLIALVLVCCLGGIAFLSMIAVVLDVAFTGAFIYLAYATRHGANSCTGIVNTPLGIGNADGNDRVNNGEDRFVNLPRFSTACRLNTACFAVAIIGAVFFFISIFVELALIKHHRKQKAYGPSPANNYTSGAPKRKFWQRKNKHAPRDIEAKPDTLPAHTTPADVRNSYNTESTAVGHEPTYNKYGNGPIASGGLAHNNINPNAPQVYGGPNTTQGYQTTTTTHVPHHGHHQQTNF